MSRTLILASASPRRLELLRAAGLDFEVEPAELDETLAPGTGALEGARELALAKARSVAARHAGRELWVLGADTIVALGEPGAERLLGKAADAAEARAMLGSLSDTRHRVLTGVAVVRARDGREWVGAETTAVRMRAILGHELEAYVASGEWIGKAGAYAIQESADRFVLGLEGGGFDNVVGLPVALSLELLAQAGWTRP